MRVRAISVPVMDQEKALQFYTEILGFQIRHDIPVGGGNRWLTVVAPEDPDGPEVLLEPSPKDFPPAKTFQAALYDAGIPWTQFEVESVQAEFERLSAAGVQFKMGPTDAGQVIIAVFDDTCNNYIQILEMK